MKILLGEDEDKMRELLTKFFEKEGYDVVGGEGRRRGFREIL